MCTDGQSFLRHVRSALTCVRVRGVIIVVGLFAVRSLCDYRRSDAPPFPAARLEFRFHAHVPPPPRTAPSSLQTSAKHGRRTHTDTRTGARKGGRPSSGTGTSRTCTPPPPLPPTRKLESCLRRNRTRTDVLIGRNCVYRFFVRLQIFAAKLRSELRFATAIGVPPSPLRVRIAYVYCTHVREATAVQESRTKIKPPPRPGRGGHAR